MKATTFKVLMISSNLESGAGAAFYRLHKELVESGIQADILYFRGAPKEGSRIIKWRSLRFTILDPLLRAIRRKLNRRFRVPGQSGFRSFDFGVSGIACTINSMDYDLVHLGWVADSIKYDELRRIKFPLVITLYDMNAMLGSYHYSCSAYFDSLNSYDNHCKHFIESLLYRRKLVALGHLQERLILTAPSRLIQNYAKKSKIFSNFEVFETSNLVPKHFVPCAPSPAVLSRYGISTGRRNILFIARDKGDTRKGAAFVSEWIEHSSRLTGVNYILIGRSRLEPARGELIDIDFINSEYDLCSIINACSLVLVPSLIDNIPQTAIESLSCGVPILTFRGNGVDELVFHSDLGYIVDRGISSQEVVEVIERTPVINLARRNSNSALFKSRYNNKNVVERYREAYRRAIEKNAE